MTDLGTQSAGSLAAMIRHRDWLQTNELRQQLRVAFREFFSNYDVLLCPVTSVPAIPHDHSPFPARTIIYGAAPSVHRFKR